jgi:hypothetical protein
MYKNRIRGGVERGERAIDREAPMTKARRRESEGRAVKDSVLTLGRSGLAPERATRKRSEKSAEVIVATEVVKD